MPDNLMNVSAPSIDTLSEGLRNLSQILSHLTIEVVIYPSLFWTDSLSSSLGNLWLRLETLEVSFDIEAPSGAWYFKDPYSPEENEQRVAVSKPGDEDAAEGEDSDEHGDTDSDLFATDSDTDESEVQEIDPNTDVSWMKFRTEPTKKAEELLEAFARACTQMPNLRRASLTTWITANARNGEYYDGGRWEWGLQYVAPREIHDLDAGVDSQQVTKRQLLWEVKDWRPSKLVWDLCRSIGSGQHSGDITETFLDLYD